MKKTTIGRRKTARPMDPWTRLRQLADSRLERVRPDCALRPLLEPVEARLLLSGASQTIAPDYIRLGPATALPGGSTPAGTASPSTYTPAEFQQAYGFSQVSFDYGVKGNGSGQTIAIVDAYNDPNITGDLKAFDSQFGLAAPPSFKVVAQDGSNNLPGTDPKGPGTNNWEGEKALDVEWAHAMAPGASVLLVEANSNGDGDLYGAAKFAASQPGVSVVSMSFGRGEGSGDTGDNSYFTTPSGHAPVTFVASSGDSGTISYPAASPNVLGVGGSAVYLDSNNNISSETAWSGSGGGVSAYEGLPGYQDGVVSQGTTKRESPDVAYNAYFGVSVYDSYNNGTTTPWSSTGGTSAGAPQWSALIAIANQGRALYGLSTLDGPSQTLPLIYSASSLDFNDITSGSNKGYSAGTGYDMVTGLGSPKADLVVYSLIGQNFYLSNGVLTVNGDQLGSNYNDTVTLGLTGSGGEQVTLNGMAVQFNAGVVKSVNVITDGGSNTVNVDATAAGVPVSIDMLTGTGTVNIAPSSDFLDNIQGNVSVTGGNSADVLDIYDQNDPFQDTYSITSSTVTRTAAATISYTSIDNVNIYGGKAGATFNVASNASGVSTLIDGGSGNDTFDISPTAKNLNNIQGTLTVWGGNGTDTLNLDDQNNATASTYSVTSSTITRAGAGTISYSSDENVKLNGGSGNDTYNVQSTASGTTLAVQGGAGNDTFNISPTAENLDNIQGNVEVGGGAGTNALNIYDSKNTKAVTYTVTSSTVGRTGAATISYDSFVQSMSLEGGSADNIYNIQSTSASTPLAVEGGVGNDAFNVSPTARNLNNIQGGLTIWGLAGTDSLDIYDNNYTGAAAYSVTSSSVSRAGAAPISFSSLESVALDGSSGNDTYNIESTAAATPMQIVAGNSSNTFNISPTAKNLGTIQGNLTVEADSNTNALVLDDQANSAGSTYTLVGSTVTRTGAATISYLSVDSLVLNGGSGNDTYNIQGTGSGTPVSVVGGAGNDVFNVSPSSQNLGTVGGALSIKGGGGLDSLMLYDQKYAANSTYTLTPTTVSRTGMATVTYSAIEDLALDGGSGNSIYNILGTAAATPVSIEAGTGANTFNISPTAKNLGTIQGNLSLDAEGNTGTNALVLFDQANAATSTYSLSGSTVSRTGTAKISFDSVARVALYGGSGGDTYNVQETYLGIPVSVVAGAGNDTFNVSPSAQNLETIGGALSINGGGGTNALVLDDQTNSVNVTYSLTPTTFSRTGLATVTYGAVASLTLKGGSGNDTYSLNGTAAGIKLALDAGKGNDTFDAIATAASSAVSVNGGAGNNTLVGPNVASTWNITGANAGNVGNVTFAAVENLTGGTANDTFKFAAAGSVSGKINGGGGTNTLDYSGDGGIAATVALASDTATRTGGFANIAHLIGSSSTADRLIGPNSTNTWSITAVNGGTVGSFNFSGVENLTGGSGLDVFVFSAGKSVSGKIVGGGVGNDWLDYAAYTTPVAVNLATSTATGVGGGIANIRNVRGGQGGDTLTGNAQGNILVGGAGPNTIIGGTGRSLLIGGKGKDTVTGNSGGDILIAGYTNFDSSGLANDLALESILAEWQSANSYATRISHIKNGGGLNGSNKLGWGVTVHDNAIANVNKLTGGGSASVQNWFFANVTHTTTNKTAGEQLN